jgi:hypothetical protein
MAGQFGNAIGGGSAIAQALARRGMSPMSGTGQVSPAAATFNPQTQPPPAPTGGSLPSAAPQAPTSQPTSPQAAPQGTLGASAMGAVNPEAQLIVRALSTRLAALTKLEAGGGTPPQTPML